jgi:hypothetical protein
LALALPREKGQGSGWSGEKGWIILYYVIDINEIILREFN